MKVCRNVIVFTFLVGIILFRLGIAQSAETTLRLATVLPINHHSTHSLELFAKLVEQKASGTVKVPVYPAGQLFSDKDMMKAVPSGALDIGCVTLSMWGGLVPTVMALDLPLYFKDRSHVWRGIDGEAGEVMKRDLEGVGAKLLYWNDGGKFEFASKMPLRTLEDFKGKRIRVVGEIQSVSVQAAAAAPALLGGGEVYMALQRGTVDGAISVVPSFWERKYYEVTKYLSDINIYNFCVYGVLMNLQKWNSLPADTQKIFLDCAKQAQEWGRKECEKMDVEAYDKLKSKMEVCVWSPKEKERLKKANEPTITLFLTRAGEKGKKVLELVEKVR